MSTKPNKKILLILFIAGIIISILSIILISKDQNQKSQADQQAERTIFAYIDAKGLDIKPGTAAYGQLMKAILLGEHPELTSEGSQFATTSIDREIIISYAAKQIKLPSYIFFIEATIPEVYLTPAR